MRSLIHKLLATQDLTIPTPTWQIADLDFDIHPVNNAPFMAFITALNNGGFFYNRSFQLYGYSEVATFTNGNFVNSLLHQHFGKFTEQLFTFGQDLFGHQFAFERESARVWHFNTETGERQIIGGNFNEWMREFENKLDYYTGEPLMKEWITEKGPVPPDARLVPVKPFVMGGEYETGNLHALPFPEYLLYYSDLAHQISGIPDGTPVKLTIKK